MLRRGRQPEKETAGEAEKREGEDAAVRECRNPPKRVYRRAQDGG